MLSWIKKDKKLSVVNSKSSQDYENFIGNKQGANIFLKIYSIVFDLMIYLKRPDVLKLSFVYF